MIRENFILNLGSDELNALNADEASFSSKFYPFINTVNVLDIINVMDRARIDTLMNGSGRIIAFDVAVKMILLIKRGQENK